MCAHMGIDLYAGRVHKINMFHLFGSKETDGRDQYQRDAVRQQQHHRYRCRRRL